MDEAVNEVGAVIEEGKFDFFAFCAVASKFMIEEDEEQMREELKEAFRIYDKEGNGYITTDVLKEILHEIDPELTNDDLDGIIEEVDEDGSGTLDFDGKCTKRFSVKSNTYYSILQGVICIATKG